MLILNEATHAVAFFIPEINQSRLRGGIVAQCILGLLSSSEAF